MCACRAIYGGNTYTSSSASTSPILLQNLSSGTTYSCYILTYLDGAYGSTSSALSVTTSSNSITTYAIPINTAASTTSDFSSFTKTVSGATGLYAYANGTYTVTVGSYSSSSFVTAAYLVFNNTHTQTFISNSYGIIFGDSPYSSSSPYAYTKTNYTTLSNSTEVYGEYIQIQLPYSFLLTSFYVTQNGVTDWSYGAFYMLGSNTGGSDWVNLYNGSAGSTTGGSSTTYTVSSNSTYYKYYRFVITNAANGSTLAGLCYIKLYGKT